MNDRQNILALQEAAMYPKIHIYFRSANIIDNERYDDLEYNAGITGRLMKKPNKTIDSRTYKYCISLEFTVNLLRLQ